MSSTRVVRAGGWSIRIDGRGIGVGLGLAAAILVVAGVALSTGSYHIPLWRVIRALTGDATPAESFILVTLRLPRLLVALLVGACLGASGAMFQSLTRNPLGSPDIVGFDTGAATGALVAILVAHAALPRVALAAVAGGLLTALVVYLLAARRGVAGYRLILVGLGVAAMLESVNSYLITRADVVDAQAAAVWLVGSLNGRDWSQVRVAATATGLLVPAALALGRGLRHLELGDDAARGLGVRAEATRLGTVVVGVGLSAAATACAGPISFVALAAPQVARRLTGASGPGIGPAALAGAALLSASDLVAQRLLGSLPVGVVTGAVGGVYLCWLLARQWRRGRG